jgi:hypothetical protein
MLDYFRSYWKVDKDLYREAIDRNLAYLDQILAECDDDLNVLMAKLRRNHIQESAR